MVKKTKIVEEYNDLQVKLLDIVSAQYICNFTIQITFSGGASRLVNFKPFLENSYYPSIRKYLNENMFMQFNVIDGNLNWNDYDLIFPIEDLYQGTI
ncbi:MAG: DUF2442 domain-containing protein [Deltaproteobacteria bacterium]